MNGRTVPFCCAVLLLAAASVRAGDARTPPSAPAVADAIASPIAVTIDADSITQTSAKLKGQVNPNGGITTVSFLYGAGSPTQSASAGILNASLGNTDVSVTVSSLVCNTNYSFYVRAQSLDKGAPPVNGTTLNFNTLPCTSQPPSATTVAANAISLTGATLRAQVNPNGTSTSAVFDYGVSADNLDQTASYGVVGSGSSAVDISKAVTNLACGTTYFFRVRATATSGNANGTTLNFSTSTCVTPAPNVSISPPSPISGTGATFNGSVNPSGSDTTVFFDYGTVPDALAQTAAVAGTLSGFSSLPVTKAVTGLTCGTAYYVRVRAQNAGGTTTGSPLAFSTTACAGAPGAVTGNANPISDTGATLNGTVNPNSLSTTAFFDFGISGGTLDRSASFGSVGAGNSPVPVASAVTGLICGTAYDFRVRATSSAGTTNGPISTFFTLACSANAPTVSTSTANAISATGATLRAIANPNGTSSNLYWDWGQSAANLDQLLTFGGIAGSSTLLYTKALTGLTCGRTYYFRARAENASGVNYGDTLSFNTSACTVTPPTVTTQAASAIGAASATLNASVNPNSNATTGLFDYGTSPVVLDQLASAGAVGSGAVAVAYSKAVTGLLCNTNYYFRARATNGGGTGTGNTLTFKTGACPVSAPVGTTLPASALTSTGATVNATVDPKGVTTSVYFDYGIAPGSLNQSFFYGYANGTSLVPLGAPLSDLACDTTYYFRVRVVSTNGTGFGAVLNFTTGSCGPKCVVDFPLYCGGGDFWANNNPGSTNIVTQYTCNGAQLGFSTGPEYTYIFSSPQAVQATVTMSGLSGDLDLYVLTSPAGYCSGDNCIRFSAFGGTTNETVSFPARANTTYYVVVDGFAGSTSSYGLSVGCTVVSTPPAATTVGSSNVSQSLATLSGTANPNGGETTVYFDYGLSPSDLSQSATYGSIGAGFADVPLSLQLFGLACGNTYYYRLRAENAAATIVGDTMSFNTGVCGGVCTVDFGLTCGSGDNWANNNPGSTNNTVSEYTCNGFTFGYEIGPEYSYLFNAPTESVVTVNLTGLSADLDLFVLTRPGGVCSGLNCFNISGFGGTTSESITFLASPGQDYNVVVDGFAGNVSSYQITASCIDNRISANGFE